MQNPPNSRILLVAGILILLFGVIFSRIVYIQVALSDQANERSRLHTIKDKKFKAVRGNIYDQEGNMLAGNEKIYEVGVELNQLKDATLAEKEEMARFLSSIMNLKKENILSALNIEYVEGKVVNATIAQNIDAEVIDQIAQIAETNKLYKAINWIPELGRCYPEGSLAANILGFYATQGYYGVEGNFDNILTKPAVETEVNVLPYQPMEIPEIPQGANIMLTIDREIQSRTEQILDAAVQNNGAASGTIIVMDPRDGAILSMAVTPRVDLNQPAGTFLRSFESVDSQGQKIELPYNRAISATYEPGSVFKVLTMAAAIDAGVVTPDTPFTDLGYYQLQGAEVYNWDYGAWGPQTMTTCMQHSLNVCLAHVAGLLETDPFYSYMYAFNIDRKTNIDLAGEAIYPFLSPRNPAPFDPDIDSRKWDPQMLARHSFGQGVAVTPIRMISSISALANEGRIMAPHVEKAIIQGEKIRYYSPNIVATPIKPETARTMTEMLSISLEGESSDALVEGYRVAGKTGTAEIASFGGYTESLTNASFVGWGPADDPEFIVYIWIEKPTSSIWSSIVAAPVFSDVVEELVILLNIPPDEIRLQMANQ